MGSQRFMIRRAQVEDAAQLLEIYRPFVERTAVSLEVELPSCEEFAARMSAILATHEWLVAEQQGMVVGYAYGCKHREREAYRFSAEVSAYVTGPMRCVGVGRALYGRLFERLAELGYCNALAGIVLPNEPSVAFHQRLGFASVGVYHGSGFKLGRWHDVAWFERRLRHGAPADRL